MHGQALTRGVTWVPLATAPADGASWSLGGQVSSCCPDESEYLPVRGLGEVSVVDDEVVYRSHGYNYLNNWPDALPQGGWMAS